MKRITYSLAGTGVKTLRIASTIILSVGIIVLLFFAYLFLDSVKQESTEWMYLAYGLIPFCISLFWYGLGTGIAYLLETVKIKRRHFLFQLANEGLEFVEAETEE